MMLIEPASKVSVPFTVVMRTRSRVPPSAGDAPAPLPRRTPSAPNCAEYVQVFPEMLVIVAMPLKTNPAFPGESIRAIPVVKVVVVIDAAALVDAQPIYPVVVTEPEPI